MQNLKFEDLPTAVGNLARKLDHIERLLNEKSSEASKDNSDKLLTVDQAAEYLNLSVQTIYIKKRKGELPFMKQGKRLYFSSKDLMDFLKEGGTNPLVEKGIDPSEYLIKRKR